jgi:hypothetical protein
VNNLACWRHIMHIMRPTVALLRLVTALHICVLRSLAGEINVTFSERTVIFSERNVTVSEKIVTFSEPSGCNAS